MSLLEKLCKELGVEVGEEWLGSDGAIYMFDDEGYLHVQCEDETNWTEFIWEATTPTIPRILRGELKPVWKPKEGETYYTPYLNYNFDGVLYNRWEWHSISESSKWHDKLGIVFQTKEEAVECAINMIELAKHGI